MKTLLISYILFIATTSFSCTCILTNVKERVKYYDIIVKAEVLSVEKASDQIEEEADTNDVTIVAHSLFGYKTTLLVKAHYKGQQIQDTMYIAPNESNCELSLKEGTTYLIYGRYINGEIHTSICSGSGVFKDNPDLKYFRRKRRLKPKMDLLNRN